MKRSEQPRRSPACAHAEPLEPRRMLAGSEGKFIDLHTGTDDAFPSTVFTMNGINYFTAGDGKRRGLWRSDGTEEGTWLVRGAFIDHGVIDEDNDLLYFRTEGGGLWRSDGTREGTEKIDSKVQEVLDVFKGWLLYRSGGLKWFTPDGESVRFDGSIDVSVTTKWSGGFPPSTATRWDSSDYFRIRDDVLYFFGVGSELFAIDDPGAAPTEIVDLRASATLRFAADLGDEFLVYTFKRLWSVDSAGNANVLIHLDKQFDRLRGLYSVGETPDGKVLLGGEAVSGYEILWVTDGTRSGSQLLKEGSDFTQLLDDRFLFIRGSSLWTTDGTEAGTVKIHEFARSSQTVGVEAFQVVDGVAYFLRADGTHVDLWRSDGSAGGTRTVWSGRAPFELRRYRGWYDSQIARTLKFSMAAMNDRLYFTLVTSHGPALWRSDGTPDGTAPLMSFALISKDLHVVNGELFFSANDPEFGLELWHSDGTKRGTKLLHDVNQERLDSPLAGSSPAEFTVAGNLAFFTAKHQVFGRELWVTDGTPAGTRIVKDIRIGRRNSNPTKLFAWQDKLFFVASTHYKDTNFGWRLSEALWVTDGTSEGTHFLLRLPERRNGLSFTANDQGVFFHADHLYHTDGTRRGTVEIPISRTAYIEGIFGAGRFAYFVLIDGDGDSLWSTDGSVEGTIKILDLGDPPPTHVYGMMRIGETIYLRSPTAGGLIWARDGTRAGRVLGGSVVLDSVRFPGGALLVCERQGSIDLFGISEDKLDTLASHIDDKYYLSGIEKLVLLENRFIFIDQHELRISDRLSLQSANPVLNSDSEPVRARDLVVAGNHLIAVSDSGDVWLVDLNFGNADLLYAGQGEFLGMFKGSLYFAAPSSHRATELFALRIPR